MGSKLLLNKQNLRIVVLIYIVNWQVDRRKLMLYVLVMRYPPDQKTIDLTLSLFYLEGRRNLILVTCQGCQ